MGKGQDPSLHDLSKKRCVLGKGQKKKGTIVRHQGTKKTPNGAGEEDAGGKVAFRNIMKRKGRDRKLNDDDKGKGMKGPLGWGRDDRWWYLWKPIGRSEERAYHTEEQGKTR